MPSRSRQTTHERPQAEPVPGAAQQRRLLADPGGRKRLPDPFQEPRRQCLSGARQIPHHHDRRGLSSNYPALLECLNHLDCPPDKIDMVILSHEHLDHIGAAWHFNESRTIIAAHRLAANKIMLRDDFSMLRKMFNEPNVPINVDIWL